MNNHYQYRGFRLQTSSNCLGWICFVDENDPLIKPQATEAQAITNGKKLVDLFWEDREKAERKMIRRKLRSSRKGGTK